MYQFIKMKGGGTWVKGSPKINEVIVTPKGYRRVISGHIARDGYGGTAVCRVEVVGKEQAEREMQAEKIVNDMAVWRFRDCIPEEPPHRADAVKLAEEILAPFPRRRWA